MGYFWGCYQVRVALFFPFQFRGSLSDELEVVSQYCFQYPFQRPSPAPPPVLYQ